MKVIQGVNVPIKAWVDGVSFEEEAQNQLVNVSGLPFIHKHIAVMPDVHAGKGSTIGSVIATKKAIVPACVGVDLGVIPGSMGAKSFVVRGKGNKESFCSCSHGAGRLMSRTKARELFTVDDHIQATKGIECRKDVDVIDETPKAYKNIDDVMAAQSDLIEVVHTLKQVVCVKG